MSGGICIVPVGSWSTGVTITVKHLQNTYRTLKGTLNTLKGSQEAF